MLPSPPNPRDPRLSMQDASPVQQHHARAASPMNLLRWPRNHPTKRASTNFLFITNLNDNITEEVLKNELSRSGAVRHVTIPVTDGHSAGIASVLLPGNADPNRFVSGFDGLPMFGKNLSVKPDHEARDFRNALKLMHNPPVPTNHDSTPPTKDTRADSNSPNWSLASQSDIEQPLSPACRAASEPRLSAHVDRRKTKPWHSNKRPRTRFEPDRHERDSPPKRRFPSEKYSYPHFAKPSSNFHNGRSPHRLRNDEHQPALPQSHRHMEFRDLPHRIDLREHTCSSRSRFEPHSPYSHRDRNSHHQMSSRGLRRDTHDGHTRMSYYANRREYGLPRRRYDDVYRENRTSRTYSTHSSGKRQRSHPFRSWDGNGRKYFGGGSRIAAGEYPAIVLRGVPLDIFQRDVYRSFTEFYAIHVLQKDTPGLYHVLFNDADDREQALRHGCFTFSGVKITPEKCLTRVDPPNHPATSGAPIPSPRTTSDDRFVSSHRSSRGSEKERNRYNIDSDKTRDVETNANGFRKNTVSPKQNDAKYSCRNGMIDQRKIQRAEVGSRHSPETASTQLNNDAKLPKCTPHEIKSRGKGLKGPNPETTQTERRESSNIPEPAADATQARLPDPSALSAGSETEKITAGHHPDGVQDNKHDVGDHGNESELAVPENGFRTRNELFDAVLRHTIESVSKQHAQLEMKRCEALVARSVFEFISAKKAERKNIQQRQSRNLVLHRVPRSANAFSELDSGSPPEASPRKAKVSATKEAQHVSASGSARRRLRKSRFSDIPDPNTTSVVVHGGKALFNSNSAAGPEKEAKLDCCLDSRQESGRTLAKDAVHGIESEISGSTVLKSSQESAQRSKTSEETGAVMEESIGATEKAERPLPHSVGLRKHTSHIANEDSPAMEMDMDGTESGGKELLGKNDPDSASNSVEQSDDKLRTSGMQVFPSELDRVLKNQTSYRHSKSSLLSSLHTESGLPSLGLFSRRPPLKTTLTPTPEGPADPTSDPKLTSEPSSASAPLPAKLGDRSKQAAKVGQATRTKGAKASVSTKKQGRKNGKAGKVKREKKPRRAAALPVRKTRSTSSIVPTSPNSDRFDLFIASEADQGTQTSGKEVETFDSGLVAKSGVKRIASGSEGQDGELDLGRDVDKADTNVDDRDGKCARTEIYIRGQNKNKRRKRLHLESLSGKSELSSRQCRQESRLYRKGVSKIKPKNDDFINLNSLQQRWKKVQFDRSQIHGMGLYAKENIEPDEFVIEYIGDLIRRTVADLREKEYTKQGMGDSYLFRLNWGTVIDATRRGGIARFINHSCDPNVIARKITIDGRSTIAFYSKRAISIGEELTYDYKFDYEAEDKKIPCLCGAANCRKYLN